MLALLQRLVASRGSWTTAPSTLSIRQSAVTHASRSCPRPRLVTIRCRLTAPRSGRRFGPSRSPTFLTLRKRFAALLAKVVGHALTRSNLLAMTRSRAHYSPCPRQIKCAMPRTTPTAADRAAVRMVRETLWEKWEPQWKELQLKKKNKKALLDSAEQVSAAAVASVTQHRHAQLPSQELLDIWTVLESEKNANKQSWMRAPNSKKQAVWAGQVAGFQVSNLQHLLTHCPVHGSFPS